MKVSIFGLGYVGSVTAACLAERGHTVIGVDPAQGKVDSINAGQAPVVEPALAGLIARAVKKGLLKATANAESAVLQTDISLLCVGTPGKKNGEPDYRFLNKVCEEIGAALVRKKRFHVIAVRSTVLPGTSRELVITTLERCSKRKAGKDFGVCHHPEFLREGSAVADFRNPSRIVIGEIDARSGKRVAALYQAMRAPVIRCSLEAGEMVKYADNAWHATKIAFANEIGTLCKSHGIDSHEVMDIFCRDDKLNLSSAYLKPGFALGGSCLPKDVRALTHKAARLKMATPLLNALLPSNEEQIERGLAMILATRKKSAGFLGISFKAGTDDMRESPLVALIQRLLAKGLHLHLYDRNVNPAALTGANRDFIYTAIPRIGELMRRSIDEVLQKSDVIVIGNADPAFSSIVKKLRPEQTVIDFVRMRQIEETHEQYQGICW